jgi:hypothetical protein
MGAASAQRFGRWSRGRIISPMDVPDVREPTPEELREWQADFEAAARRPLATRLRYAFIHTYKPVLDDAPFRAFDSMAAYREWCARHLPSWLGYGPAV